MNGPMDRHTSRTCLSFWYFSFGNTSRRTAVPRGSVSQTHSSAGYLFTCCFTCCFTASQITLVRATCVHTIHTTCMHVSHCNRSMILAMAGKRHYEMVTELDRRLASGLRPQPAGAFRGQTLAVLISRDGNEGCKFTYYPTETITLAHARWTAGHILLHPCTHQHVRYIMCESVIESKIDP